MRMIGSNSTMYSLATRLLILIEAAALVFDANTKAFAGFEANQLSFECIYMRKFYVSFDLEAANVVMETLSGELLKGKIDSTVDESIFFHVEKPGQSHFKYMINTKAGSLTSFRVPNEPNYSEQVFSCTPVKLRDSLSKFGDL
ncbi:hypothetical protein [Bradyrhizobium oligotrophicum]|uniref:hypothetical protein n=1 Tax=Bradyrhizobium oligotrophicum TaxID=44255 RepID=UPI003EBDAC33